MFVGTNKAETRWVFIARCSVWRPGTEQSWICSLVHGESRPQDISWRIATWPSVHRGLLCVCINRRVFNT